MMVDDDDRRPMVSHIVGHALQARNGVEVHANHQVRAPDDANRRLRHVVIGNHRVTARKPGQEVGEGIGHNHVHTLAQAHKIMIHRQRGAHRVTVGRNMTEDNDTARRLNQLTPAAERTFTQIRFQKGEWYRHHLRVFSNSIKRLQS